MSAIGEIHLTSDPQGFIQSLQLLQRQMRIFESTDLRIAQAKEIINEAYIADSELKHIIIIAQSFSTEAQNALLKILEEPPANTKFYILTQNKNALIPTIRSRLVLYNHQKAPPLQALPYAFNPLSFTQIYECLKEAEKIYNKNEAQLFIERLLYTLREQKINLTQQELEMFHQAIDKILRYERLHFVLVPILLSLKEKR